MIKVNTGDWTYGAEHELADWDYNSDIPIGFDRDRRDVTIVNSNGIANDPSGKMWHLGGEINTPPTSSPQGQGSAFHRFLTFHPVAKVNYRSNLHIHVRVPGLGEDLVWLKRVQLYIHQNMPAVLQQIEPILRPTATDHPIPSELEGALRRWRRRRVSHQTLLTPQRLRAQLDATSVEEFFRWEVPQSRAGTPQWHFQPRLCVSLRQILQTDTVEFRHFPGTLNDRQVTSCVDWCHHFMVWALQSRPIEKLLAEPFAQRGYYPEFPMYNHRLERRYRATCHDHSISKSEIQSNIKLILENRFEEVHGYD